MAKRSTSPRVSAKRSPNKSTVIKTGSTLRHFAEAPGMRKAVKWFLLPSLVYLLSFFIFSPHWWGAFSTHYYLDSGDGFQNVWNIWWVNEALTQLGQNPYFSNFLHFPHGVPLITQTMNIFNGLVAIPLMGAGMSLVEATNTMVTFSFVVGGLTMFWFVHHLTKSYWVSLFAGFLFTFSSYHFAHALGHLQLVSLEWLPLFLLMWWRLMEDWKYKFALGAAGALFLVILCDYYYFLYGVIAAAIIFFYFLATKRFTLEPRIFKVGAVFIVTCLILVGPFIWGLLTANPKSDPLQGSHPADMFGLDILSPFIPGGNWLGNDLTAWHWERLPGYKSETSIYLGLVVIVGVILALFWRKKFDLPKWINVWWIIFFVFAVFSLGRHPRAMGMDIESIPMPYLFLEKVFPPLQMSGMPIRMIIMVLIAGIVISAFVLMKINIKTRAGIALAVGIVALTIVEMYPFPLPKTPILQPEYVNVLKKLELKPGSGIIDNAAESSPHALYAQTEHEKPMAFGYTTRMPLSVSEKSFHVFAAIEENRHADLCTRFKIRYMATRNVYDNGFPIIYEEPEQNIRIYDLKTNDAC